MKTFNRWLALFFGILALAWPHIALAAWTRADTHNFVFFSDGAPAELEHFARDVERFDALLRRRFNVPRDVDPKKLTVYVLASQSAVADIAGDKSGITAGFYLPNSEGSYIVINRNKKDDLFDLSGQEVLFHEYAHHFMFRHFTNAYPGWFVEGFAEFVATATIAEDGSSTLGKPARYRTRNLITDNPIPIEMLLKNDRRKMTIDQTLQFYGRSWLLVHMLSTRPEYDGRLAEYLKAVSNGASSVDAAKSVFGDLRVLDKALYSYVSAKLSYISSTRLLTVDGDVKLTALDPLASRLVGFRLQRRAGGQLDQAESALKSLTSQYPNNAEAWAELAITEMAISGRAAAKAERERRDTERKAKEKEESKSKSKDKNNSDDDIEVVALRDDDTADMHAKDDLAEAAADRALAIDPNNLLANVVKGEAATWRLRQSRATSPAAWSAARAWYRKANAVDHDDAMSALGWFMSFKRQGKVPPESAVAGLEAAFSRAPEADDLRSALSLDLARRGRYDEAISMIKVIAFSPHGGTKGKALLKKLEGMKAAAEAEAAISAPTNTAKPKG